MATNRIARPPFDPELGAVLPVIRAQTPVMSAETLTQIRALDTTALAITPEVMAEHGLVSSEFVIAGYEGAEIEVTVFARADHAGTGPGVFFAHGGGMMAGRRLSGTVGYVPWIVDNDAVFVTVEYRLAPEFPDPYPVEDCYAGLVWMAEHAADLGVDPARIMIAGSSAGGGLAAGTALMARDRQGPALIGQMLICPMLDDRDQTASARQYDGVGTTWDQASNQFGWSSLLGDRCGTDDVSIYAAPARATDLSGLPPAFIDCGSAEVFRDENVAYATALWAAGVQAELHVWAGGFHGSDLVAPQAAVSKAATAARNDWVTRLIGS